MRRFTLWPCKPPALFELVPVHSHQSPTISNHSTRTFKIMASNADQRIKDLIGSSRIFVFMKGNKLMPQCGFSNNVVQILNSLGVPFETFDVLSDMEIRQGIKDYSNWPTIPQVYLDGEFIGGSDILIEMYNSGELREKLNVVLAS